MNWGRRGKSTHSLIQGTVREFVWRESNIMKIS